MPFYDYVCQACGRRVEVMHGVHATGPDRCDACGGRMQRVISRPSIHFKGSGWAKMDARANTAKAAGGRESGGSTADSATSTDDAAKHDDAAKDDTPAQPAAAEGSTAAPATKADRATRGTAGSRSRDEA